MNKFVKPLFAALTAFSISAMVGTQAFAEENVNEKILDKYRGPLTELVFVLDKSGSMFGLEEDTIGGFNSLIKKQKEESGKARVTAVLFNDKVKTLYDRVPLNKVEPITKKEYFVGGTTALLDAVGETINRIKNNRLEQDNDKPVKTLFVIITDGYENASKEYNYTKVKQLITNQKEKEKWEFLFLGANIDAAKEADRFGIARNRAVRYKNDSKGVAKNYEVVSKIVASYSSGQSISDNWSAEIEKDYNNREADKK